MLEGIVSTTFPENGKTLKSKNRHANRADYRKRRTDNSEDAVNLFVDDVQTHKIKNRYRYPIMVSFLIFCVCVMNVIIKCDVSVSAVNFKERSGLYIHGVRDKIAMYHGHKYDNRYYGRNLRKGRVSAKRHTQSENKTNKYGADSQELTKYYDFYKNKEDVVNVTKYPQFFIDIPRYYDDTRAIGYPHDLASNPYYVKNINFNLRPERHQFDEKIVKLGVLLPADPNQVFSLVKVLPILEMAVPAVTKPDGPLPGWKILVDYRDTRCSSVEGPLAAFEFYVNGSAGK